MAAQHHSFDGKKPLKKAFTFGLQAFFALGLPCAMACLLAMPLSACHSEQASGDSLSKVKERGYLIVGVNYGNPPFGLYTAVDDHYVLKGFDIDLSRAIAKRLLPNRKDPVQFRQVLTSTRLVALNTQGVDMIAASMSITPNRKQRVAFSMPYYAIHQKIMVPAASNAHSMKDLTGKTILTVNGSTAQSRLQKQYPKLHIKGYATLHEAFTALQRNEGEALSNDDMLLKGLFQQKCALSSQYRFLPEQLSTEYYGLVFQKTGQDHVNLLQKKVDVILGQFSTDGTLETLKKRWEKIDCL